MKIRDILEEFYADLRDYGVLIALSYLRRNLSYRPSFSSYLWKMDSVIHYAISMQSDWKEKSLLSCFRDRNKGYSLLYLLRFRKKSKLNWEQICNFYLKHWGWNKKAREDFFKWGEYGFNNGKLHDTNYFSDFLSELHYCSDRMSLDRLFRCQVLFRNAVDNPEVVEDADADADADE